MICDICPSILISLRYNWYRYEKDKLELASKQSQQSHVNIRIGTFKRKQWTGAVERERLNSGKDPKAVYVYI